MKIITTWYGNQFNVELASADGRDPFLSVRGCRIMNGKNGEFVSWPATKNETTGKWWNHVWANEAFADEVLKQALLTRSPSEPQRSYADKDNIPF